MTFFVEAAACRETRSVPNVYKYINKKNKDAHDYTMEK